MAPGLARRSNVLLRLRGRPIRLHLLLVLVLVLLLLRLNSSEEQSLDELTLAVPESGAGGGREGVKGGDAVSRGTFRRSVELAQTRGSKETERRKRRRRTGPPCPPCTTPHP